MPAPEGRLSARATLAREEQRTVAALRRSLVHAGEDVFATETLKRLVREHPEFAVAASAGLGALLAPTLARTLRTWVPHGAGTSLALRIAAELAQIAPEEEEG